MTQGTLTEFPLGIANPISHVGHSYTGTNYRGLESGECGHETNFGVEEVADKALQVSALGFRRIRKPSSEITLRQLLLLVRGFFALNFALFLNG